MSKRIALLLASTLLLIGSWRLFNLSNDKIDLFLFYELEQKLTWYVYYTSNYLTIIIYSYIVHLLCKIHYPKLKTLTTVILIFAILRLIIYWLFRGSVVLDAIIWSFLIYVILKYKQL